MHMVRHLYPLNVMTRMWFEVLTQDYTADVNIMPRQRFFHPTGLLGVLSPEEAGDLIREGERAAWPKLERIRNCTMIGRAIAAILRELRVVIGQVFRRVERVWNADGRVVGPVRRSCDLRLGPVLRHGLFECRLGCGSNCAAKRLPLPVRGKSFPVDLNATSRPCKNLPLSMSRSTTTSATNVTSFAATFQTTSDRRLGRVASTS